VDAVSCASLLPAALALTDARVRARSENDITDVLEESFSTTEDRFGELVTIELKPDGESINVTEENKEEYVEVRLAVVLFCRPARCVLRTPPSSQSQLLVEHRIAKRVQDQFTAFLEGFCESIPLELIRVFDENELELLIGGVSEIDMCVPRSPASCFVRRRAFFFSPARRRAFFPTLRGAVLLVLRGTALFFVLRAALLMHADRDDWTKFTDYRGYERTDQVIEWFWQCLRSWPAERKARLLQFTTGTSRVPVNGFKDLQVRFLSFPFPLAARTDGWLTDTRRARTARAGSRSRRAETRTGCRGATRASTASTCRRTRTMRVWRRSCYLRSSACSFSPFCIGV
jgi:hypothetical protein